MSRIVKIPECMNPFDVWVNGAKYSYPAGTEQEVPDNVADVIEHHIEQKKAEPAGVNACNADLVISLKADYWSSEKVTTDKLSIKSGSLRSVFERLKKKEEVKVILEHEYWYNESHFLGVLQPVQVSASEVLYGGNVYQQVCAAFCASGIPNSRGYIWSLVFAIDVESGSFETIRTGRME